jgi:hypothetical protein
MIVKNSLNTDVTTTLAPFLTLSPIGDSLQGTFSLTVSSSLNLNTNQPYIVTIYAMLKKDNTKQITDTLTLTVKNLCAGAITATLITKSSDRTLNTGDSSIYYSLDSYFNCPGETLSPTYVISTLDPAFTHNSGANTITWVRNSFAADATFTITVTGTL